MWANPYLSPIFVLFPYNGHSQQYTNIYEVFPLTSNVYICNYIYLDLYIITVYIYVYVAQMRLVMVQSITTVYRRDHISSLVCTCHGTYQPHTYIQWGSLESPVPSYIPYLIYIIVINYGQQLLYIHICVYIYTIPTIYIDRYLLWHRLVVYMVYIGTVYLMSMLTHTHACTVHMLYS